MHVSMIGNSMNTSSGLMRRTSALLAVLLATSFAARADEPKPSPQPASPPPVATPAPTAKPSPGAADKAAPSELGSTRDAPKKGRTYVDEDYDFKVAVPEGWFRTNPASYGAAGEICRVWSPGSETTIMVYRVKSEEPYLPLTLLDETAEAMSTKRHATILEQEVRKISGMQAVWLVMSGPGNGGAIEGQGLISTVQQMVIVPRAHDAVIFMLGTPEAKHSEHRPVFEKLIESLEMGGEQNDAQKASA